MSFSGLANHYGSSDSSDDSDGSPSHEGKNSSSENLAVTKSEPGCNTKRPRVGTPDDCSLKKPRLLEKGLSPPPRPPPSFFASSGTTSSAVAPPPPFSTADQITPVPRPPPPPFLESGAEIGFEERVAPGPGVTKSTSKQLKGSLQASIHFLPPQVRTKRPNLSTEDLNSYGCKKGKR